MTQTQGPNTDRKVRETEATDRGPMRKLMAAVLLVGFLGWLDTNFLVGVHMEVLPLPEAAPIEGTQWEVITSEWSYLMGVPSAMYGAAFYLLVITLSTTWLTFRMPQVEKLLLPVTAVGLVMSANFVYQMFFVIDAVCPLCMVSAASTTALFVLSAVIYHRSEAPGLRDLDVSGLLRREMLWPLVLLLVGGLALTTYWLVGVLPLPVPQA